MCVSNKYQRFLRSAQSKIRTHSCETEQSDEWIEIQVDIHFLNDLPLLIGDICEKLSPNCEKIY